jgi:hypothetical protein
MADTSSKCAGVNPDAQHQDVGAVWQKIVKAKAISIANALAFNTGAYVLDEVT